METRTARTRRPGLGQPERADQDHHTRQLSGLTAWRWRRLTPSTGHLHRRRCPIGAICSLAHGKRGSKQAARGLSEQEQADRRGRATRLYQRRNYPPEKVATAIVQAVEHNRAMVPVTPEARAGLLLSRIAPSLTRALFRRSFG
jgi:hypothetical protein